MGASAPYLMETSERIETINKFLRNKYGIDTVSGQEMWKVMWSEDPEAYQWIHDTYTDWTDSGIFIREVEETRFVKKWNYITERYILVNLQGIPYETQEQLNGLKTSYEPVWTFETPATHQYLPPAADSCEFIIDTIYSKLGRAGHATRKYTDPRAGMDTEEQVKAERRRVDEIILELFGEDSGITQKFGDTVILDNRSKEIN